MKIKIISDFELLKGAKGEDYEIALREYPSSGNRLKKIVQYFFISYRYDYFLLHFTNDIFLYGILKLLFPFNRCKFITLDIFLNAPKSSVREHFKSMIITLALKSIDLIFLYSRRNDRLCQAYRIDPEKVVYIPFKINSYDYVLNHQVSDKGYIFSGGRSRRDYTTLIEAVRGLPYPLKILVPSLDEAKSNGTIIDENRLPPNVQAVHDDGSIESFVGYLANSRLVVLPLKADDLASTGTSVYLLSMALKKCVIISSGPTTDDILNSEKAIIVPPENPTALRAAIKMAFNDDNLRNTIGENGYTYAIQLGDENRLVKSIANEIYSHYVVRNKKKS